jgi:predicted DNA binding CopG/RHH family protein
MKKNKKKMIQFRCTEDEENLWKREAAKKSMSFSSYIRFILNKEKK